MALTATFDADFSAFLGEISKAKEQCAALLDTTDALSESVTQVADSDAPAAMQQLGGATEQVTEANTGLVQSITEFVAGYLTATAILAGVEAAFTSLVGVISDSIAQAAEAEDAQTGLVGALTAQGTAVPSVITAFENYAAALAKTTIYSDDAVVAAEKVLVLIGGVMPRDMEKALKATTQLAAGLGIELPAAARLLAKAADGNVTALKKYGVEVEDSGGKTKDFAGILVAIDKQFGDIAQRMAETYAGQVKKAGNAWDEVKESMGKAITDNETVRTALKALNALIVTNTGELKQNATVNTLVSDAVILVAKGFLLAVDGIDYFQKELTDTRKIIDVVGRELNYFYLTLQGIELATQKPLAWAGSEEAKKRVEEANAAIERAKGNIVAFNMDMMVADDTSKAWSASLATTRTGLEAMIKNLETTRGKIHEVTAAQEENAAVWNKGTGDITTQTMALQEHTQAMDLLGKGYVKIGTDVTAVAKARETAAMTEAGAAAKAEAEFWKLHDAEEQWQLQTAQTADTTVAAVGRIAETVIVHGNAMTQAMQGWTAGMGFTGAVGQLPTPTAGYNPATMGYAPWAMQSPSYLSGLGKPAGLANVGWNAGVTFNPGSVVMNYPIVNDPTAMDQLGRLVGEAIISKMTRTGARV
jgi:hypothetical protein